MGFVPELDRLRNWKIYLFRIEYVKPLRAVLKYLAGLKFLGFFISITHWKNTPRWSVYSQMDWPGRNKFTANPLFLFFP